ncbi:MAG: AAA family ATPase [Lachnospiraceae bacterium]|nr:AAA family ATPase [Lachnospiraceae bacterium]
MNTEQRKNHNTFETNIRTGQTLSNMVKHVRSFQKRDGFEKIIQYLYSNDYTRVCAVYGLRRTGKTTMLFQAIGEMSAEDFAKTAYVKMRTSDQMQQLASDLDRLYQDGFQYVFIDEVTLMEDFIDSAALLSDIYVPMGMRIVLSGTDSLGFWLAEGNELYDRVRMVHTTFIPYKEYSRLLGIDSIDEYIRYGGTLRKGETDFDDAELNDGDASFRDDESTRKYIDTAICKNIQHSLARCEQGNYFRHLFELYEAGELTGAINRIIEDMNHRFVLSVLTKDFKSSDLGITAKNFRKDRNPEKRTSILYEVDQKAITRRLMTILDIRNGEDRKIGITHEHAVEIRQYLKAMDLIVDCPSEVGEPGLRPEEHILFTQPGMRYCQAQALVHSLMKDELFMTLESDHRIVISERILEEVRGRMMEEIILLETAKALGRNFSVFKFRFARGEFDMVIYDKKQNACAVYEIKHSDQCIREQARHLMDDEKLCLTTPRFGKMVGRYVLYLGKNLDTEDGIAYRNAEQFLKNLPGVTLESGLEEPSVIEENSVSG